MKKNLQSYPFVSCWHRVSTDRSVPIVDDGGHTHYTAAYTADTKGSMYFPEKRPATGRKVFVFDPKATAWAAYDANGDRVETGSASW